MTKLIYILSLMFCFQSFAAPAVGTLVAIQGDIKLLHPKRPKKSVGRAQYEGKKYFVTKPRIGEKLKAQQVIMTGTNGRGKVIYTNGDSVTVGPGTAVILPGAQAAKRKQRPVLNMHYGKLRALISKKGPRKNLKLQTKTAVAGVRGTDFYLAHQGAKGTEVTVLRGAVEVAKITKKRGKTPPLPEKKLVVKPGFVARVEAPPTSKKDVKKAKPAILEKVTQQELIEVQRVSTVKTDQQALEEVDEEVQQKIVQLEKTSLDTVTEEIKEEDPRLFEQITSGKNDQDQKVEVLNTLVVSKLYKEAPKAPKPKKPRLKDIQEIGEDIYEKYFESTK